MLLEIEKPLRTDPLAWAKWAKVHNQWLRAVAPGFELDMEKLLLGDVLSNIVGDDSNCFTWDFGGDAYTPEAARIAQQFIVERLTWEIETPELPEEIRGRCFEVLDKVKPLDFGNQIEYGEAKRTWFLMLDKVRDLVGRTPRFKEALSYHLRSAAVLSETYQRFLDT